MLTWKWKESQCEFNKLLFFPTNWEVSYKSSFLYSSLDVDPWWRIIYMYYMYPSLNIWVVLIKHCEPQIPSQSTWFHAMPVHLNSPAWSESGSFLSCLLEEVISHSRSFEKRQPEEKQRDPYINTQRAPGLLSAHVISNEHAKILLTFPFHTRHFSVSTFLPVHVMFMR